jgi:alkylhydroperoxidase/carboxymuconolactone decarboxylase family protein YurZ
MNADGGAVTADEAAIVEEFYPTSFERRRAVLEALDPPFAANWASHSARLLARPGLDKRKRFLVLTGQYTMRGDRDALEETLVGAVAHGVDLHELLEALLQCYVYAGGAKVAAAAEVLLAVLESQGLLDDFQQKLSAADITTTGRSLEEERAAWSTGDRDDPRTEVFLERYGWHGFSTGLRLRPGHHINLLATLDIVDSDFAQIWLDCVYQNMYARRVLDDGTRLLCTVGDCFAVGETHQATRHMRGALRAGVAPRELLEVVFQTCAVVGHPYMLPIAVDDLVNILDDEGRLNELVAEADIPELTRIVSARLAKRAGVQDALDPVAGRT